MHGPVISPDFYRQTVGNGLLSPISRRRFRMYFWPVSPAAQSRPAERSGGRHPNLLFRLSQAENGEGVLCLLGTLARIAMGPEGPMSRGPGAAHPLQGL